MTQVTVEQLRSRLAEFEERKAYYEWKSENAEGRLKRHEVWRHTYLSFPYLIGATDGRVAERFCDIFINQSELGNEGKIGIRPGFETDDSFSQKFTHMLEEYDSRGGMPARVIQTAKKPILSYFENGDPIAVKMFAAYHPPSTPYVVKYGRKEFLEPMLHKGKIRICPATFYNNTSFVESVQDDETSRVFFIPTFRERLIGQHFIDFQGRRIAFGNDDIVLPVVVPDYYLFSLCDQIYYRLPTDFKADAALIIRDPVRFSQCVISAFMARRPDWEPLYGSIAYYDPYRDYTKAGVPEMLKHFRYAYQREVRIAFRSKQSLRTTLEPEFLTIGSMSEYAELICV